MFLYANQLLYIYFIIKLLMEHCFLVLIYMCVKLIKPVISEFVYQKDLYLISDNIEIS